MPLEGQGRLPTLASIIVSLAILALIAAYGIYFLSFHKNDIEVGGMGGSNISSRQSQSNVQDIRDLRVVLLERTKGEESSRFKSVFYRLEVAATEGKIDYKALQQLPNYIEAYLSDGIISEDEMTEILDELESSIIRRPGQYQQGE